MMTASAESEVTVSFVVNVRGYGTEDKVVPEKALSLCRALWATYGDLASVKLCVGPRLHEVEFDHTAPEGGAIVNDPFRPWNVSP